MNIIKRDGSLQPFEARKIEIAVQKSIGETEGADPATALFVANEVALAVKDMCEEEEDNPYRCVNGNPSVEEIQNIVEQTLMKMEVFEAAKSYILYRNERDKNRRLDIFEPRKTLKPYEYPEIMEYVDAIRHSYWIHTEFNYTSDIQDWNVNVEPHERESIKRAMLAISQMEVAVKNFWGDLHHKLPKPEIGSVGATFAESEVRHADAYAHLLEILGLNEDFKDILDVPVLKERYDYLQAASSPGINDKENTKSIILFSLLIEHVSLFSQFLIIMSFNKYKNLFKGVSNVVEATSKEEQIHGLFGIDLVGIIRDEHPEWFDNKTNNDIEKFCRDAYDVEERVIDWIFEEGELDFMPKDVVKEFVKNRLNNSIEAIGFGRPFPTTDKLVEQTDWFDNEVIATKHVDFFQKRSINYNKRSSAITGDDLFD